MGELFDNREIATGVWLLALLIFAVSNRGTRRALGGVVKAVLTPQLVLPVAFLWAYIAFVVWRVSLVGLWNASLLRDTILWSLTAAVAPFVAIQAARKESHFFLRGLKAAIGADVAFEYVINMRPFDLVWELALQPTLFFLVTMMTIAEYKAEHRRLKPFLGAILFGIALAILVHTVRGFLAARNEFDSRATLLDFGLSIWLSVAILPIVYLVALWATYEDAFLRLAWATNDPRARRRAKIAMLVGLGTRARDVDKFLPHWGKEVSEASSLRDAFRVVQQFKASLRAREHARRQFTENLVKYAGSNEVDEEGRRMDVREFKATRDALRWVHTCHLGWYDRQRRYRPDLMSIIQDDFERRGLPAEHGISMRVSADGQSWYAWRRTVSGWCFAIGATNKPPSQYLYDGPAAPTGFPTTAPEWGSSGVDLSRARNWFGMEPPS